MRKGLEKALFEARVWLEVAIERCPDVSLARRLRAIQGDIEDVEAACKSLGYVGSGKEVR